jgi:hypothetical protein
MAPVTATNVGMAPQIIDNPKLQTLMDKLNSFQVNTEDSSFISDLVKELSGYSSWRFEEQVRVILCVFSMTTTNIHA